MTISETPPCRVGVAGTGFTARHLLRVLVSSRDLAIARVLTRRPLNNIKGVDLEDCLTHSINELVDNSDLIVECSGDPVHAFDVVEAAMGAGLPVVTLNPAFHITAGAYFSDRGWLSEAEGDQPGALAALHENALSMGFRPWVLGNIKGYLDHSPTPSNVRYWARRQGQRPGLVLEATDGTKLQIEQTLVANGLGADIACKGLIGPEDQDLERAGFLLADKARQAGRCLSDYVINPTAPKGVFTIVEHDIEFAPMLAYFGLGEGERHMLLQNFFLGALEVPKTIRRWQQGKPPLLNNGTRPGISVAAIAKRAIETGRRIKRSIGSFSLRGEAVKISDFPDHVPIGLLDGATIVRPVEKDQILSWDDVIPRESPALHAWNEIMDRRRPQ